MRRDFWSAIRQIRVAPVVTLVAVGSLAFGIGATAAISTLITRFC